MERPESERKLSGRYITKKRNVTQNIGTNLMVLIIFRWGKFYTRGSHQNMDDESIM